MGAINFELFGEKFFLQQKKALGISRFYNWDGDKGGRYRRVAVINRDFTETDDYTILIIGRDTSQECIEEFYSQLYDGVFENWKIEDWEEINPNNFMQIKEVKKLFLNNYENFRY